MTAKITASADGLKVLIGNAAEDALEIDQTAKTIKGINGYMMEGLPSGAISDFAMQTPPEGWLACDGAAVSRTTYAALFAAIGTVWGNGNGSTTFNVPDMRGRFRRMEGTDGSSGMSADAFAAKQDDGFRSHTHSYLYSNAAGAATTTISRGNLESTGVSIVSSGPSTGVAAETRPFNVAVQTCIKI